MFLNIATSSAKNLSNPSFRMRLLRPEAGNTLPFFLLSIAIYLFPALSARDFYPSLGGIAQPTPPFGGIST
jgi:hypothetical protein